MLILLALPLLLASSSFAKPCSSKQYDNGLVCVCDNYYCDTAPELGDLDSSVLKIIYTSNTEAGFNTKETTFVNQSDPGVLQISINNSDTHQQIIGFGAGFTDATGINIKSLDADTQQNLLESFYGESGIELTLMRVPIGASEFSTKAYTIDDTWDDHDLANCFLPYEDTVLKIPYIQRALAITKRSINLIATPWSAPMWMKSPTVWTGGSVLRDDHYQVFANYYTKFLDQYESNNITFWGVTTGNEPFSGFIPYDKPVSMGWAASQQARWLTDNLAPTLKNSNAYYKDIKILIFDDGLLPMPYIVPHFLENDTLLQHVDGVATHPNWDSNMTPRIRYLGMTDKKDIFRLSTQASHSGVSLGDWSKADDYIKSIIELLTEYDYGGWMESNLALDSSGGPTYVGLNSDAPVIVDASNGQFFKQPTFYALGHFSKFVSPNAVRLGVSQSGDLVKSAAFLRPDGLKVTVIYNYNDRNVNVQIQDNGRISSTVELSPLSINTFLYKDQNA